MDEQSLLLQPQRKKKLSIVSTAEFIATIQSNPNDKTVLLNRIEPLEQLKLSLAGEGRGCGGCVCGPWVVRRRWD
jgi:uncharacterized protein (DUF2126 family)